MMSSGGMPAFDEFAGLDAIADDWFTDTSFGNEVGGNGDDQHHQDFNSSMAGGSMALDVPMDDGGAGPMLQPLQTFHADASGQQQTLQQGYVQQMQPSTAQQYAAPDGNRQQSSEFQTLQPYDPGPQQQQQQLVAQQQTQQAYYHQQQPSTSSAPTMTAEYVTMDSAYVTCQPTTSAAAPQTLQMNQPFDQQQILQSDQNVEYHQTAEGTWIAIHRAAPGQQPQQQQQVHSDAQQQQHGGNMAQLMPLSNQHQSMQQQPMQQQQQRQPQQYQQAPQQQQQQYAAEHKFVEIDGTQQTIVYTQQPQQQRRSNDGQQILVTSMGQQRQVVQRQQIPQQQQQTHHQQQPTSYTVVQQNGQQVTYVDQRSMVALSGPHDQQQTQYVQSSQGSSGATYHAVQVLQPNGTVQTQMRLVQPQQSQQQAVDSKPPVQFQSLTGQPPPHPMSVKQPQPPPQPQPTATAATRPSRPPPKKKNNARVQQQPLQIPQHQPQQIIHVQQAPPQQPDSAAVGEVLGKVAQSGGFVMSTENSAELARLGMLQSQLQDEQQMRGVDNSMRLQQIERDMLALLTGAMPVAASLQQAMSQPAPPPPAPTPQPVYVQQQQPPPEEKPKPAAKAKRPRPSRAKPKAPVNNQPPVVTKAEIVEPQVTIAQPNVIYVDANGNPIQLPPGAIIQTMTPNSTFATDEYSIVHNTQPSTSYSIIETSTAQSQPSVAKPATSKAAQARARKSALAAAQNAQHQPAQLVVYATQQPASNVPTTCTVTVRNDPIGQPRPLADASRKAPKAPSPPKPKPIILPKPAELGKRIEEKRAVHTFRLGNYFEGLRNSLQQTDYKSEFRDLSDAVSRLLPFSLLSEPDLSEAVLEQFDYEYTRHSMHMSERLCKVDSRLRSIFLKDAMEERDKDSELNMLLALDIEYERRQLDEDKKAASMDLESFVRGSELLRLPSVNQSAVKEAKANLREPKSFGKGPQHYEFHEFDPQRYRSISPLPPSPPSVVEHTKSESETDYSSDEERSIQSPPKPWQRSAEKLAFGSPKETLVQPPMPQRLPTPSSLLPNETIVWEPEPIRPRSSAQERLMPATAPMSQKPLETPPPLAKAKSPEGMQPALSPQSMALQSQSHLPMKLRMKSLSMLKPLAQRRPEPPAVVEVAPPQLTIDDAVASIPSCTVVCEKLQLPPDDATETPQQAQPSETLSETPPKPKVQPPERPIMTVRPMVKGRDEITRSMTASLQRIADRLPQAAGPQSDNKAYGIEESDSDEERANDEPKKPRVMLKINLKKPDDGKEQDARADNGEDEEAERKRRKKERKEEKKRKKKEEKSKKEERRRLRELQDHKDHDEALLNALKQPRISLKLSAKAGQPLHVEKSVSNNVEVPVAAAPTEHHHVEKIRIPRPVEAKPPAAAEEPPKQKLTLNFKKLLAARNTAPSEDIAQQTLPPPVVQQHHAQVPVAPPQLIAEDQSDDWPVAGKKKKRGAKNSSDEDSDWEASRKGRNKKVKHVKQSGKPEKKMRHPKKGPTPSLDGDAASPPKRPRLVMKLGRPPPAPEPVNVAPPLSSFAAKDVPPEPLKMKPLKIKIGGKVPKQATESPKETKSPGLPAAQRPHATTPSTSSHRPGFSFFATSKVPASKANAKKSSQPSVGRSASSSSKRDAAQQPSSAAQQLPRQPSLSSSQLPSAPAPMPRQSATPAMHQSMPSTPLMPSVPTTPHTMPATPQSMPHTPHPVASQQYANHPTPVARPPSVHEPVHPPPQPKDAFRSSSTARSFMEQSDPNFPSHGASGFDDTLFASRERIQFSPCSDEEVDQLHKQTSDVLKKLGIKR